MRHCTAILAAQSHPCRVPHIIEHKQAAGPGGRCGPGLVCTMPRARVTMSFHTAIGDGVWAPTVYFLPQHSLRVRGPVVSLWGGRGGWGKRTKEEGRANHTHPHTHPSRDSFSLALFMTTAFAGGPVDGPSFCIGIDRYQLYSFGPS